MYSDAVSSERHGRLLSNSGEEYACRLYAKLLHETLLDSPVSPLPRIKALLDAATQPFRPLDRSPDHTDFAREAYRYISALMQESHRVSIHAQRRIGLLFSAAQSSHHGTQVTVSSMDWAICNCASDERKAYYRRVRDECSQAGCGDCTAAKQQADTPGSASSQLQPCQVTQRTCCLKDHEFFNFTTTYMAQCRKVASLPTHSTLLRSCVPHAQFRDLVGAADGTEDRVLHEGLPTIASAHVSVFALEKGESPVEAIQYVDGDGGFIVSEKFPGLYSYLEGIKMVPDPCVQLQQHGYTLLPFREQYHDAIELGHVYDVAADIDVPLRSTSRTLHQELGYEALVAARRNLSKAERLWIVPADEFHGYVCR